MVAGWNLIEVEWYEWVSGWSDRAEWSQWSGRWKVTREWSREVRADH